MHRGSVFLGALAVAAALGVGPAAAQLPALQDRPLSSAERTRLSSLEVQFTRISTQRNTSVAALRTIARAMGTRLTSLDPDQVLKAVEERAGELARSRERIGELERDLEAMDSMKLAQAVGPLLNEARTAIDEGRLEDAETRLQAAGERFAQARGALQGRVDQLAGQEAEIYAQRAGVRFALFDPKGAADLYGRAAEAAPASEPARRWKYRLDQARALAEHGEVALEPESTARALEVLTRDALPLAPRQERPQDWATTQFRIGLAQTRLGYQRNDNATLLKGVEAIRNAVDLTGKDTADGEWVDRRVRLATSLSMLSERTDDVAPLQESLAMFRDAAAQRAKSGPEFYRAYGTALGRLGLHMERVGKEAEAIEAYKASTDAFRTGIAQADPAANPRVAGDLHNNLSFALKLLGSKLRDPAYTRQSIEAARSGLQFVDRERLPMVWVTLKRRYGWGLVELSTLDPKADPKGLDEGVAALREAISAVGKEKAPMLWAGLQQDLAQGLQSQGERAAGAEALAPAIAAYRASNEVVSPTQGPGIWAENLLSIAELSLEQARRAGPAGRGPYLSSATDAIAAAEPVVAKLAEAPLAKRLAETKARLETASKG